MAFEEVIDIVIVLTTRYTMAVSENPGSRLPFRAGAAVGRVLTAPHVSGHPPTSTTPRGSPRHQRHVDAPHARLYLAAHALARSGSAHRRVRRRRRDQGGATTRRVRHAHVELAPAARSQGGAWRHRRELARAERHVPRAALVARRLVVPSQALNETALATAAERTVVLAVLVRMIRAH